jgi:apolipoprotein N-acyltransferase
MSEPTLFLVTGCLLLAAVMIPVPRRGRIVLWIFMLGLIVFLWVGITLGDFAPLS